MQFFKSNIPGKQVLGGVSTKSGHVSGWSVKGGSTGLSHSMGPQRHSISMHTIGKGKLAAGAALAGAAGYGAFRLHQHHENAFQNSISSHIA